MRTGTRSKDHWVSEARMDPDGVVRFYAITQPEFTRQQAIARALKHRTWARVMRGTTFIWDNNNREVKAA